ncbi:MAG: energy-coupling factor transporter transmembrane component T family protein [Candidatus Bathyarchaeia archaeon]
MSQRSMFVHISKDSPLNRLHPLPKLALILTINTVALIIEAPIPFLILILLVALTFKIARVPFMRIWRLIIVLIIVSQAVIISYVFTSKIPGRILYEFPWGTYVSDMTLLFSLSMILRYLTMLLGSTLILCTTSDRDITYGIISLRLPYSLAFIFTLAFRSTSIFIDDFAKVRDAMILRGTDFYKGSIVSRARNYARLLIPLIFIALRRVVEYTYAVEAKGFTITGKRTYLHRYEVKMRDIALSTILALSVLSALILKHWLNILTFPGWPLNMLLGR